MVKAERHPAGFTKTDRGFLALILIFVVSLILLTPRIYSGDEIQYYAYLRSLWKDHDLKFQNEYQHIYDQAPAKQQNFKKAFIDRLNPTGYARNDAPIGCAILWSPFFAIADLYARSTHKYPADGFSFPYVFAICFASAFYGFLGFLLQYRILRDFFSAWVSFWAVLTLWFGAHAVYYMYVTPPMSHATSIFTTSLFVFTWYKLRNRDSVSAWFLIGIVGGLAAIVRWQDAIFLVIPIFDRKQIRLKIICLVAAFLMFIPQLAVWWILNGELNPYSTGNLKGKLFWNGKYFLPVLFSSYHGLFTWTPVIALCIIGFFYLIKTEKSFWLLVLVFVLQFYFVICADTWQGGSGFGLRYLISCTIVFTFGIAALYSRWTPKVVPAVSIFFIIWNLFMVIQVGTGMIPRDGHFKISQMLRNQFVEVPKRLGEITYRFIFKRSSFYDKNKK
jgi:hypothetical protein